MKVLKGILKDSKEYYEKERKLLEKELFRLPKGSIKKRKIGNNYYYYLQYRERKKVIHKYLGKLAPQKIIKEIERRHLLLNELQKVKDSLKLLAKVK